jgi:hypothetical protein
MWQGIVFVVLVVFLYHTDKKHIVINGNFGLAFMIDK